MALAEREKIPYQLGASHAGGTDTCTLRRWSGNVRTALISIPSINMHTGVEVVDWRDLSSATDLLVNWIKKECN